MKTKIIRMAAAVSSIIFAVALIVLIKINTVIRSFNEAVRDDKSKSLEVYNIESRAREYGYWEILNSIFTRNDVKVLSILENENTNKSVSFIIEINGDKTKVEEIINYLKLRENFSAVNDILVKNDGREQIIQLKIEFLKNQ